MTFIHWYEGRNYPEQREKIIQEAVGMKHETIYNQNYKPIARVEMYTTWRDDGIFGTFWDLYSLLDSVYVIKKAWADDPDNAIHLAKLFCVRNSTNMELNKTGVKSDLEDLSGVYPPETAPIRVIDVLAFAYGIVPDATNWDFLLAAAPTNIADVLRTELYEQLGDSARDVEARVNAMRKVLNR